MDLFEAIYTTRSMRRLHPDPIPAEVLPILFDAAIRGPNSGNTQLFRFVCVTDPDLKATIAEIYQRCLAELHRTKYSGTQELISSGDRADPRVGEAMAIDKSARWLADNLHAAPMLIFAFGKEGGETSTFPCLWNLCLAARAHGLGTTITTLLKLEKDTVEDLLGVPPGDVWHMHAMVPIGYPTGRWGVPRRQPAHDAVFAERWGTAVGWRSDAPEWPPASA